MTTLKVIAERVEINNLIANIMFGKNIVEFKMMQTSSSDSQTNSSRYELVSDEDLDYALERSYEGCNYLSSLEELEEILEIDKYEILLLLLNNGEINVWETTNTQTWEVSKGWN